MPFRRTQGIVTDNTASDPKKEADIIMTAAALGFAASYISTNAQPIQFDMDPLDTREPAKQAAFTKTVGKLDAAVAAYLKRKGIAPSPVHAGVSPGYSQGAVIMGVYKLAGQSAPQSVSAPVLSAKGRALWEEIAAVSPEMSQYTGRGAYTGFVDNKNTEGDTNPIGPRSTVRMTAPASGADSPGAPHPRWLPPMESALWNPRKRKGQQTHVPWGLIMGDSAGVDPDGSNTTGASNLADQSTIEMQKKYGMTFTSEVTNDDVATYTHGMIQAIYKAYALGPSCEPYEIAVGDKTKKMASCLPCTLFMSATGYPPNSIHLGRGESWAPLYGPYNPSGSTEPNEVGVVRDLNNTWYEKCLEWLNIGLDVLDDAHITDDHKPSREDVRNYLRINKGDPTVGGVLILDAVTVHDGDADRIARTLK